MTEHATALEVLSGSLCPWLGEALTSLEQAHNGSRLGHAWLVAGPEGTGKINLVLAFADRLLRGKLGHAPPGPLGPAKAVAAMRERHVPANHHPDLYWLHPEEDKRTISVEQVRAVAQALVLKGLQGLNKVLIVEPAEAMTVGASNALLKTLEEPTNDTYLLLISHQPGRVAPTVRSRCQTLALSVPQAEVSVDWLASLNDPASTDVLSYTGRAPVRAAQRMNEEYMNNISELNNKLNAIYRFELDPQALADEWRKLDVAILIEWLVMQLQFAIRARFLANATDFTDTPIGTLHKTWRALTLRTLFKQLQAVEELREQLGGGINVDLALRVVLLGFQPDRGRL